MGAKHTPGPWKWSAYRRAVLGEPARSTAVVVAVPPEGPESCHAVWPKVEADMRLIAAAPELLAALRRLEEWAGWATTELGAPIPSCVNAARAAIAKAEGR